MIILDACILIAYLTPNDAHHDRAVALLLDHADEEFAVSALTQAEVLVHPAKSGRENEVATNLSSLGIEVIPIGEVQAIDLSRTRARTGLRMPDACVLVATLEHRARLATFDATLASAAERAGLIVLR